MSLSSDLISQFVKATKDTTKAKNESTVYGTTVEYNGSTYVKLDGSDLLTPISTTVVTKPGERVTVMIKDHTATITGNISSPAARTGDVEEVSDEIAEFEIVMAYKVTSEDLEATNAVIENLRVKVAKFDDIDAVNAAIDNLEATFADLDYVSSNEMNVITADIEKLEATFADIKDISTEDLDALYADIVTLKGYTADFTYVSTDVLQAFKADIKQLDVDKLSASDAKLTYASIDFSNIGEAAIRKIFSDTGIIKDLVVGNGSITGELVGVTIKGDLIEGNTVKADKLVVKGSDGLYYKLNFEAGTFADGEVVPDDSIHGSVITAKSITAEKVSVHDLVAFGATIGGFHIRGRDEETPGAIYSGVKESVHAAVPGVYLDDDGQMSIGDANSYVKFYKDEVGNYKLAISLVDNLKIGGRNLIRNSSTLIFEDYGFFDVSYDVTTDVTNDIANVTDSTSVFGAEVIDRVLYLIEQADTTVNAEIQNGVLTVY